MSVKNENIFSNTAPARKTRHVLRQPSSRTLCNQYHYHAAGALTGERLYSNAAAVATLRHWVHNGCVFYCRVD